MKAWMKLLAVAVVVVAVEGPAAQTHIVKPLSSNGATTLDASSATLKVSVAVKARDFKTSDIMGDRVDPGQYPDTLRIIQNIEITVNGSRIHVPHSAYADLLNARQAEISVGGKSPTLILRGGDGSESFVARIEFDKTTVKRRAVFNALQTGEAVEETTYNRRVLRDD